MTIKRYLTGITLNHFIRDKLMRKRYLPLTGVVLFALLTGGAMAQSDDDYLKSLEGEASDLNLDSQTKSNASDGRKPAESSLGDWSGSDAGAIKDLVPGLTIGQFEQVLKNNYIGSYLFYKRLSNQQKDEIFVFYQGNPDSKQVRDKILQVSKN